MENTAELKKHLQLFNTKIAQYKKLFLEDDGKIDSEEQKKLDKLNEKIALIKGKLTAFLRFHKSKDYSTIEEFQTIYNFQPTFPVINC